MVVGLTRLGYCVTNPARSVVGRREGSLTRLETPVDRRLLVSAAWDTLEHMYEEYSFGVDGVSTLPGRSADHGGAAHGGESG